MVKVNSLNFWNNRSPIRNFSIYLLANLITNLDKKLIINIKFFNQINFQEIYILFFLISAIISAFLYFLSNKNIVSKMSNRKIREEEITDLTLNIQWEYYLKISQGDISKSILSRDRI